MMHPKRYALAVLGFTALLTAASLRPARSERQAFSFAILGDRTGEATPGVYERILKQAAGEHVAFVLTVGDSIQGLKDRTAEAEWQQFGRLRAPLRKIPLFLTPGNHDIWSAASERLFIQNAGHNPHYSFDFGPAHVTVLDNSRAEQFSPGEMAFLEADLQAHAAQPLKFIVSHRPSWLFPVLLRDTNLPLHTLARKYGVQYVIAGHVHQMLRFNLQGVTYLSMPSAGGHLRQSKKYEDGWFFAHTLVRVDAGGAHFRIRELGPPYGKGRDTRPEDWGALGAESLRH